MNELGTNRRCETRAGHRVRGEHSRVCPSGQRRGWFSLSPQWGEGWERGSAQPMWNALGVPTPHPLIPLPLKERGKLEFSRLGQTKRTHKSNRAFTLIEIMVVVGIMAVIMTIAIPSVYQQMHKDSIRQAISDITEACTQARERAILNGVTTEVRIQPGNRQISAVESGGSDGGAFGGGSAFDENGEAKVQHRGGGGTIFTAKLSDHIIIEFIGVNLIADLQQLDEVSASFYPNGTSDELVIVIRSDRGEVRQISTEVVTGIADVEVKK